MENKRPGTKQRTITTERDGWAWDSNKIEQKTVKKAPDECWEWQGNSNQAGNLIGAYKLDTATGRYRPQMTQANRIIAREHVDHSLTGYSVYMTCGNSYCANFNHMRVTPVGAGRGKTSK